MRRGFFVVTGGRRRFRKCQSEGNGRFYLKIFLSAKYTHAFNLDALTFIKIIRETFRSGLTTVKTSMQ
jgi:hypothetical protein